jgi:protein-disulfide isomerase
MRLLPLVLAAAFLLAGPAVTAGEALTPVQRKAVEETVRDYLRNNPEILLEAIQALRVKEEAAAAERQRAALTQLRPALEREAASPVGGNPNGDVTVVEFFDYRCGFCKKVFPTMREVMKADTGIRYVFKEFPILGPESVTAARAALAAWKQAPDKYFAFHSALMEMKGNLTEDKVFDLAAEVRLDVKRLRQDMTASDVEAEIARNHALAEQLGISGTPAFVVGSHIVPGAIDRASLERLVAQARKP